MAVTVAVRGTVLVVGPVGVVGPGSVPAAMLATRSCPVPATLSGVMDTTGVAARPATVTVTGTMPVPRAGAVSRAGAVIVPTACPGAKTSPATGHGKRAELTGPGPLSSVPGAWALAARARSAALTRPRSGPVAAIDPLTGPVSGTGTRSGRSAGAAARSGSGSGRTTGSAGAVAQPEPALRAGVVAISAARPGGAPGTASARWLGGRVRGSLRRGHRPIIARTTGALCSPRPN